jgi:hypothetical protein
MKKSVSVLCIFIFLGCTRGANDPAEQALVQLNRAVVTGSPGAFLKLLSPNMIQEVTTRLGLPQNSGIDRVSERLVLVPGIGFEKIQSFKPRLIRERSNLTERWYKVDLGELKLQIPVRKFGEEWRVALNEALLDG